LVIPITESDGENIICDYGYDCEQLLEQVLDKGSVPHIPHKSNSRKSNPTVTGTPLKIFLLDEFSQGRACPGFLLIVERLLS
jgi:hypothetical protein